MRALLRHRFEDDMLRSLKHENHTAGSTPSPASAASLDPHFLATADSSTTKCAIVDVVAERSGASSAAVLHAYLPSEADTLCKVAMPRHALLKTTTEKILDTYERVLTRYLAEEIHRAYAADDGAQTWEIQTPIAFPGVVVRLVTTMNVALDAEAPALSLTSGESRTEAPGAPGWIAKLFDAIASSTVTDTSNAVTFRDAAGGGRLEAVSSVSLSVRLNLPGWVPLPLAQIEKSGSESLQKVLEKDMPAVLASFREGFLAWEARQS